MRPTRQQIGEALIEALNGYAHPMTCKGAKELRVGAWGIKPEKCSCGAVARRARATVIAREFVKQPKPKRKRAP